MVSLMDARPDTTHCAPARGSFCCPGLINSPTRRPTPQKNPWIHQETGAASRADGALQVCVEHSLNLGKVGDPRLELGTSCVSCMRASQLRQSPRPRPLSDEPEYIRRAPDRPPQRPG